MHNRSYCYVHCVGDSLKSAGGYLTAAVLVGLLKGRSENGLNLVSAPAYAKELGFKVSCSHSLLALAVIMSARSAQCIILVLLKSDFLFFH